MRELAKECFVIERKDPNGGWLVIDRCHSMFLALRAFESFCLQDGDGRYRLTSPEELE